MAKRGLKVLGIEQFGIAHNLGSSHGETRIIRQAYFEHPDYVPLAVRAYELWEDLEAESRSQLMQLSGVVLAGPAEGEAIAGSKLSARQHGLDLEELSPRDAESRFPGLRFSEDLAIVYEPHAGYLFVEDCVQTHIEQALKYGGSLLTNEAVQEWSSDGKTVTVRTTKETYQAAGLVITAGAWAAKLLNDLALPLTVLRKPVFWHGATTGYQKAIPRLPGFLFELSNGVFYGLPGRDGKSVKLAEHSGGQTVVDPHFVDREISLEDHRKVTDFQTQCVPAVVSHPQSQNVCLYTMTRDGHFVVDRHPRYSNVVLGAGFSGHGFKFTGVIGEALADLVQDQTPALPVEFLSLSRGALSRNLDHDA